MGYAPLKTEQYVDDSNFALAMGQGLSRFILILFLIPLIRFVYSMTQEKESKIKEAMLMMGMSEGGYNCSWFVYYVVIAFSQCLLLAIFGALFFFSSSNGIILFLVYFFYALSVFGLVNFFQALFSSPRNALIVAIILYWLSSFLAIVVANPDIDSNFKYLSSLIPTVGIILVSSNLGTFEASGSGVQFSNWDVVYNNYTIVGYLGMTIISAILFWLLGWYLENVLPHDWGVRRPLCFCFTRSYCCPSGRKTTTKRRGRSALLEEEGLSHKFMQMPEEEDEGGW